MFFLDEKGNIQEGTPLSNAEKETLDRMIEIFHASPDVCGGFHPSYNVKCLKLALEMRNRFDIAAKLDFEYAEVEQPVEEEPTEEAMFIVTAPAPLPEPTPEPVAILTDDDLF
jgi:hypothetical protein